MRTWLLLTLDDGERIYQGNTGYNDDTQYVYRYDSFVPNHRGVQVGDTCIIRGKKEVVGSAVIQSIDSARGKKTRNRCPSCRGTSLKVRKVARPRFRCECGEEFDQPEHHEVECTVCEAYFGDTFAEFEKPPDIEQLWKMSPKLNKQFSILELDTAQARTYLARSVTESSHTSEMPAAILTRGQEGAVRRVMVNRYERDRSLRNVCINHHKCQCIVCGFDFEMHFGEVGKGVIEVHHLNPIAEAGGPVEVDPIRDLVPVCPNCHTIIHRRDPPFEIDEVRELLVRQ